MKLEWQMQRENFENAKLEFLFLELRIRTHVSCSLFTAVTLILWLLLIESNDWYCLCFA